MKTDYLETLKEKIRISSVRLAIINSLLFMIGGVLTITVVYWQVSVYMQNRVDQIIEVNSRSFYNKSFDQISKHVDELISRDFRKVEYYAVFNSDGTKLIGNLNFQPHEIGVDGQIREFKNTSIAQNLYNTLDVYDYSLIRAKAILIDHEHILVIGRDISEFASIRRILFYGLTVGSSIVLIFGLIIGLALGIKPLKRVKAIEHLTNKIILGNFSLRLPISNSRDELDMLSSTVNLMLSEIEKLMVDIKSVSSTIAHDLRTPLSRIRFLLIKGVNSNQDLNNDLSRLNLEIFTKSIAETDLLLNRFTAMLRIAEIENNLRKIGFKNINPKIILDQIIEMFEPIAEEKGINLELLTSASFEIFADKSLLLEAISNLIDNAIKFTQPLNLNNEHNNDPILNQKSLVKLVLFNCNNQCIIGILDQGIGMPNELINAINTSDIGISDSLFWNEYASSEMVSSGSELAAQIDPTSKNIANLSDSDQNSVEHLKLIEYNLQRSNHELGQQNGHGLGLGIVQAVLRLHQYKIHIEKTHIGTNIYICCPFFKMDQGL